VGSRSISDIGRIVERANPIGGSGSCREGRDKGGGSAGRRGSVTQ
jgi:hypothetical protein